MTELERYILQNRDQLENIEAPSGPEAVWTKVAARVNPGQRPFTARRVERRRWFQLAAAASIGLLIGLGMWQVLPQNWTQETRAEPSIANFFPDLADREAEYRKLIARKEVEIGIDQLDPREYSDIFMELELLDTFREEYLRDMAKVPSDDDLVETLLRFYERKVRILERLNNEIEKKNHHEKKFDETHL